jgi:NitT/TauT family transport system substrate-binding protein
MFYKAFLFTALLCIGFFVHSQKPTITFTPHWLPQAQFAGYYMALEKGFYAEEGITVSIEHPSASINASERLVSGESDIISLFLISGMAAKNTGIDLVNVAQVSQNSALMFVTKKEKGITNLSGLNEKKIGVWKSGFDEVGKALISSNNYSVEWVPILSTINLFMNDGIDALTVMWYNEYYQIVNAGLNHDEINTFFFSDYGYNIPEDGLYCLNSTYIQRKGDIEKFVRATFRGWEYVENNRDESLEVILRWMKEAKIPTNISHQSWMLEKVLELLDPGNKNVKRGELAETDYHKAQSILIEGADYKKRIPFDDFYKPVCNNINN